MAKAPGKRAFKRDARREKRAQAAAGLRKVRWKVGKAVIKGLSLHGGVSEWQVQ